MATTTAAPAPTQGQQNLPPFAMASSFMSRQAFTVPPTTLTSSTQQPVGFPLNLRSFGWVSNVVMKITITNTTGGVFNAINGPAGVFDNIGVRTSNGQYIITGQNGYNIYLGNKYFGKTFGPSTPMGRNADPYTLYGTNLNPANNGGTVVFWLALQFELDHTTGLGCLPSTASDREFTIDATLASLSSLFSTEPTNVSTAPPQVSIDATAWYWDLPAGGQVPFGVSQQSQTYGLITIESDTINAGLTTTQSSAKGNIIANSLIKVKGGSGRSESVMSPTFEIDLDNQPRLWFEQDAWRTYMSQWFDYGAQGEALDAPGGQDSGVFVVPWRLLAGGQGALGLSNAQYFATLSSSQIDFKGFNYGSGATSLEIITDSVTTPNPQYVYSH